MADPVKTRENDGVCESLGCLHVMNMGLGHKEGFEHERILFYYPQSPPRGMSPAEWDGLQTRNVGLAAALVGFTTEFSPDKPCEAVVTQKTLQVFYQCELPDVWLVLTMRKGGKPRPGVAPPVENDGASDDRILRMQQLARMCWNTFTLFHGDTKSLMARQGPQGRDGWDGVRGALREFMPRYLPGIRLDRPGDVLMALGGMHFLPVDKQSYLRIQLMINALEMRFRTIVGTVFLYDGDLISSGLEMEPTRLIYQFLSEHLFGEPARPVDVAPKRSGGLLGGFGMDASSPRDTPRESGMDIGGTATRWRDAFGVMHASEVGQGMMPLHTVYVGGDIGHVGRVTPVEPEPEPEPEQEQEQDRLGRPTGTGAGAGPKPARYHLLIYSQPPATLVFVFEHPDGPYDSFSAATAAAGAGVPPPKAAGPDLTDFTHFLKPMLEQELMNLAQAIGGSGRGKPAPPPPSGSGSEFRFVYFNRMNLAVKVSDGFGGSALTPEFLRQLGSMHIEFSADEGVREVCTKTAADHWIIGRRVGEREFYMLLDQAPRKQSPPRCDSHGQL